MEAHSAKLWALFHVIGNKKQHMIPAAWIVAVFFEEAKWNM